jgi:glycosyltransferase family protein
VNIRYNKFFHFPRQIAKSILSALYPIVISLWKLPKVLSIEDTFELIIKEKKSVARFGDGEFLYICDKLSLPFQIYTEELACRFKEILAYREDLILVGLPSGYYGLDNLNSTSKLFWRCQIAWIYPRLRKYLNLNRVYVNASMTRLYIELQDKNASAKYFKLAKLIWEKRNVVLIEGEKSRLGVGNDLFAGALSVRRILGPMHNAFEKYGQLLNVALGFDKNILFLVALGPTAKPLVFDLAKNGYQAIDIGNIDIEYEWFLSDAKKRVKIKGKYTSEAKDGRNVEDLLDIQYSREIIAWIKND